VVYFYQSISYKKIEVVIGVLRIQEHPASNHCDQEGRRILRRDEIGKAHGFMQSLRTYRTPQRM
jgi:hypothetical protein